MTRSTRHMLFSLGLAGLALAACAPTVATRGNLVEEDRLAVIREGVTSRDEAAQVLGTPSTTGTFDPNTWYYIGQRTEKTAFFKPDVIERKVVVLHFNDAGIVEKMEKLALNNGQEIEVVDRATPTAGHDLSFLEQMMGNVGKFSGGPRSATGNSRLSPTRRPSM